ncbi:MAG: sulfurtransferase TusA family protein [Alphaproteobacteria bacterium]|nr:sulfurtransferase TusA family protein [Alphaproteobacteria bacterium]
MDHTQPNSGGERADEADYFLDITGDICPMTFVRTKLQIERMKAGETCDVRLANPEPLKTVPASVRQMGHEVLSITPENPDASPFAPHVMRIRKV